MTPETATVARYLLTRAVALLAGAVMALAGAIEAQETVSFPTEDGGIVFADVYGTGDHGVVLAHGGRFDKTSWAEQATWLVAAGFRVVAIDFRGRGQSRGGPPSGDLYDDLKFDVLGAVAYLRSLGARTVSVVGASLGGFAAAQAAVTAPEAIDRLVLLAHSPIDHPERLPGRTLFLTSRDDTDGQGRRRLPTIRDQFERAPEPKQLIVLEGAAHAQFVFDTEQGERVLHAIRTFLLAP